MATTDHGTYGLQHPTHPSYIHHRVETLSGIGRPLEGEVSGGGWSRYNSSEAGPGQEERGEEGRPWILLLPGDPLPKKWCTRGWEVSRHTSRRYVSIDAFCIVMGIA